MLYTRRAGSSQTKEAHFRFDRLSYEERNPRIRKMRKNILQLIYAHCEFFSLPLYKRIYREPQ